MAKKRIGLVFVFLMIQLFLMTSILYAFNEAHLKKLNTSTECVNCDLSNANLSNIDLSNTNFTGANLSGATWIDGKKCKSGSRDKCK